MTMLILMKICNLNIQLGVAATLSDVDEGQELLLTVGVVLGLFCIFIHIFHIDIQWRLHTLDSVGCW